MPSCILWVGLIVSLGAWFGHSEPIDESVDAVIQHINSVCRLNHLEVGESAWGVQSQICADLTTASSCRANAKCLWDDATIANRYVDFATAILAAKNAGPYIIAPGVHVLYGMGNAYVASTTLVETANGVIAINAGQSRAGSATVAAYVAANFGGKRITHLVMTHAHFDEFSDSVTILAASGPLTVICTPTFFTDLQVQAAIAPLVNTSLAGANLVRNFGTSLPRDTEWRLIQTMVFDGRPLVPGTPGVSFMYVAADGQLLTIDGVQIRAYITPADLPGQFSLYFPATKILYASDVVCGTLPPLSTYRSDPVRNIYSWISSVMKIKDLDYDILVASSIPPFTESRQSAHDYVTYFLGFLLDVNAHVVNGLSAGIDPHTIETSYSLPAQYRYENNPYWPMMLETYHPLPVMVRGAIMSYIGAADSEYAGLLKSSRQTEREMLVFVAGGAQKAAMRAQELVRAADRDSLIMAVRIGEALIAMEQNVYKARLVLYEACKLLGSQQLSFTARNYFMTCAWENRPYS